MYDPVTAALVGATVTLGVSQQRQARKARKKTEEIASTAIAEEKAQLLKEEEALEQSVISARNKALQERRARQIRRGRSSTIIAGRGATPNLTQLGQVLKKKLGTGA